MTDFAINARRGMSESQGASDIVGKWIALGVALGVGLGVSFDNLGTGIALGVAIGAAIGTAKSKRPPDQP